MRKFSALLAAVVLALTASVASAAVTWTADFGPGRNATQAGSVTIEDMGSSIKVTLNMTAMGTDPQPAHIHVGACPGVGAVAFPLSPVVNGKSETTVNTTLANLMASQHAINVHKSPQEAAVYTACVELPMGTVLTLGPGRNATQPGYAVLQSMGNQTEVTLVLEPMGGPQPAHIHVGTCPGVGAVAFPLTSVQNGESVTTVNASLQQIQATQHAINVHKSPQEAAVYTACVNIPVAAQAASAAQPAAAAPTQLPRTGGADVGLLAVLGASLAGAGIALRRK